MSSNSPDLNTLIALNKQMNNPDTQIAVENAKIKSPSKEVEGSLTSFLTARFDKLTEDSDFENMVKANIMQRLPEASFKELTDLLHVVSMDNTSSTASVLKLFHNETSGKNVVDTLRESDVSTAASQLYDSTEDKNVLQALSYLGQVMSQISVNTSNLKDVVLDDDD